MKRNVLLFVSVPGHFKLMVSVANAFRSSGHYNAIIIFAFPYSGIEKDINAVISNNIDYILIYNNHPAISKKARFSIKKFFLFFNDTASNFNVTTIFKCRYTLSSGTYKNCLSNSFILFLRSVLLKSYWILWKTNLVRMWPTSSNAKKIFNILPAIVEQYNAKLIILPEHNLFYLTHLFVYLLRSYSAKAIIVPFTIANSLEWKETYYNISKYHVNNKIINQIFAYIFPSWTCYFKNKRLILPLQLILIYEFLKISPKNPWMLNDGDIDFFSIEGEATEDYYIKAGIDKNILRKTGALYNDRLYCNLQNAENLRLSIYDDLEYKIDKQFILLALPPDQTCNRKNKIDFLDYETTIRFLISESCKYSNDYYIIISLHPRTTMDDIKFLKEYPIGISTKNIEELIPVCKFFVASVSATIRMAISCATPVLNYDLYRYNYDDYRNITGVITTTEKQIFVSELKKLAYDVNYFNEKKIAQSFESRRWGVLDGNSGKNLLSEVDLLLGNIG